MNYTSLVADTRKKGLELIGNVSRMDQGKRVKKILEGSRRKRKPKLRWLEGVEKDLREMKFKR